MMPGLVNKDHVVAYEYCDWCLRTHGPYCHPSYKYSTAYLWWVRYDTNRRT